jgi:hypothetical protein
MQLPIKLTWINDSENEHHLPYIGATIADIVLMCDKIRSGKRGEQLSIQKMDRAAIPSDVIKYAPWTATREPLMRAEWAFLEDDQFFCFQKYFTDELTYSWQYYPDATPDFFRVQGDEWSICFRVTADSTYQNRNQGSVSVYGGWHSAIEITFLTSGDMEAFETDMTMYKLMGYFNPSE